MDKPDEHARLRASTTSGWPCERLDAAAARRRAGSTVAGAATDPVAALAGAARTGRGGGRALPRHPDAGPVGNRSAAPVAAPALHRVHDRVMRGPCGHRLRTRRARLPAQAVRARAARCARSARSSGCARGRPASARRRRTFAASRASWRRSSRPGAGSSERRVARRRADDGPRRGARSAHFIARRQADVRRRRRDASTSIDHDARASLEERARRAALRAHPPGDDREHRRSCRSCIPAVDGGVLVRLKDDGKSELSVARDRVRELKQRLGI